MYAMYADLKEEIMLEVHNSTCTIHPRRVKMYRDLKENFWSRMKRKIALFVA